MKKFLKLFIVSFAVIYLLITFVWVAGRPEGCAPGEEIAEGCQIAFPDTYLGILAISLPSSLAVTGIVTAFKRNKY